MIWLGGGGQRTGDYDTPIGTVENSKSRILNGSAGFGWFGSKAFASLDYKGNEGRYGIPFANVLHAHGHEEEEPAEGEEHVEGEEEHAEEELEAVDLAFRRHNGRFTGGFRNLGAVIDGFQLSLNYSDWNHDEVETLHPDIQEIGTTFENQMFSYRGVFIQGRRGPSSGSFGFQGAVRSYEATGEEALSPPVDQNVFAAFALQELDFEGGQLQVGGRI